MKWRSSAFVVLIGLCALTSSHLHQYHFIGRTLTWSKARTYCRKWYTDLATVINTAEMKRLVNTAQDSTGGFTQMAWIGLHDNLTSWRWSSSDSLYRRNKDKYRNWMFGQPDNFFGNQMCVKMLSKGMWEDTQCALKNPFICYDGTSTTSQRFIFVEKKMSWSDAQRYCRKSYTDLASVRDQKENQEIQLLTKNRSVWIGLHRRREWSDQSESKFLYWKYGKPDNFGRKQYCIATDLSNAGLWSDEQCSKKLAFICYSENNESPGEPVLSTTTIKEPNSTDITSNHVVILGVNLKSNKQLSEDDIKDLVIEQFHNLLKETGLPKSIKVRLKRINNAGWKDLG